MPSITFMSVDPKSARTVSVGEREYSVDGDAWEDYRCELLFRLSTDYVLGAARRVNPRVKVIIKYPQWYDRFHDRGYDVIRESEALKAVTRAALRPLVWGAELLMD